MGEKLATVREEGVEGFIVWPFTDTLVMRRRMLDNWLEWVSRIARVAKKRIPQAQVYVTGSIVEGGYTGASDVDVVVVAPEPPHSLLARARLKTVIEEELGLPYYHPFEIHIVSPSELQAFARKARLVPVESLLQEPSGL